LGALAIIESDFNDQLGKTKAATASLRSAIPLVEDQTLQARWQFILSQRYEYQGDWEKAIAGYHRVSDYKPQPIMKLYAALNPVLLQALHHTDQYAKTKEKILQIAGKRKFAHFKSIIYMHLGK